SSDLRPVDDALAIGRLAVLVRRREHDVRRRDLDRLRGGQKAHLTALDQRRDLVIQDLLDVLGADLRAAVADRHVHPGAPAAQRRLDRRVPPADDQQPPPEVPVRVVEEVRDVRQVLAGDVQAARAGHAAARHDDVPRPVHVPRGERLSVQLKAAVAALNRFDLLVGVERDVELLDDRTQVGEIVLRRDAPLLDGRDGHTGYRDALRRAEELGLVRPAGEGLADLPRVEDDVVRTGALEAHGQLKADRPGADDGDVVQAVVGLRHVPYPCLTHITSIRYVYSVIGRAEQ